MRQIEIEDTTYDRLVVAARLMNLTVGQVIAQLVDRLASDPAPQPGPLERATPTRTTAAYTPPARVATDPDVEWIPVYKVYKGNRIDGAFSPRSHEVQLKTQPWANKTFPSPTAAAVAVVEHYSGDVRESPNTNGRKFWKVEETGKNLHSIIGER